jgi:hypothetical protein
VDEKSIEHGNYCNGSRTEVPGCGSISCWSDSSRSIVDGRGRYSAGAKIAIATTEFSLCEKHDSVKEIHRDRNVVWSKAVHTKALIFSRFLVP